MAQESGMSRAQVSASKKLLAKNRLIVVVAGKNPRRDADSIRIVDIWPLNVEEFSVYVVNTEDTGQVTDKYGNAIPSVHMVNTESAQCSYGEQKSSYGEQKSSYGEQKSSYGELGVQEVVTKKISLRRSHEEENPSVSTTVETSPQAEKVTGIWIVEIYNAETPPDHPKHTLPLSPARLKRATEYARRFPDPAFWHAVFAEVWRSPWMQGQRASRDHRAIKRDLFWMMQTEQGGAQENCVKVYEGKYRDDGSPGTDMLSRLSEKERRTAAATQRILAEDDHGGEQRQNTLLHAVEQDGRRLL